MKTLRNIIPLNEIPEINYDYSKDNRLGDYKELPYNTKHAPLSITSTGHHIYSKHFMGTTLYYAHNPKTNQPDMSVSGQQYGREFEIHVLSGRKGSSIKAHQFYGHLMKHHSLTLLGSTSQSPGSKQVWKNVSQDKDIDTEHLDKERRKIPLAKGAEWDKNYGRGYEDSYFKARKKSWYKKITETPEMLKGYDEEGGRLTDDKAHYDTSKPPLSTTASGHQIYKAEGESTHYLAHNPETGLPDMWASGKQKGNVFHEIALAGRKGSKIKAKQFYAHLVKHHGLTIISSDLHSRGGANVWKGFAEEPGIHMTRHTGIFKRELHLHRGENWDKNYADHYKSYFKATKK